jgi:hypothetical protein
MVANRAFNIIKADWFWRSLGELRSAQATSITASDDVGKR